MAVVRRGVVLMLRTALCGVAVAGVAPALACSVVAPDPHAPPPVPPTTEEAARLVAQTVAIKTRQLMAILAGADTVFVGTALDTKTTRDAGRKTRFRIVERIAGRLWGRVKTLHWTETFYDDGCQAYSNAFQLQSTYLIALDDGRVQYMRRMDDPQHPEMFTFEAALQVAREAARAGKVGVGGSAD
jgi:hypothetical protein